MTRHTARTAAAALGLLLCCACSGGAGMPSPAEAVSNLRAEGTFRFEAFADLGFEGGEMAATGAVDLDAGAAEYYPSFNPVAESEGILVVGSDLYAPDPDRGPHRWQRSGLGDGRGGWIEEGILPMDGGALMGLLALQDIEEAGSEVHAGTDGQRCSFAELGEDAGQVQYCVDGQDRLRFVERSAEDGTLTVSYHDPGVAVTITPPSPEHVRDLDFDEPPGD